MFLVHHKHSVPSMSKRLHKIHTEVEKRKKKLYGDSHIILNKGNSDKTNRNVQIRSPKF